MGVPGIRGRVEVEQAVQAAAAASGDDDGHVGRLADGVVEALHHALPADARDEVVPGCGSFIGSMAMWSVPSPARSRAVWRIMST